MKCSALHNVSVLLISIRSSQHLCSDGTAVIAVSTLWSTPIGAGCFFFSALLSKTCCSKSPASQRMLQEVSLLPIPSNWVTCGPYASQNAWLSRTIPACFLSPTRAWCTMPAPWTTQTTENHGVRSRWGSHKKLSRRVHLYWSKIYGVNQNI